MPRGVVSTSMWLLTGAEGATSAPREVGGYAKANHEKQRTKRRTSRRGGQKHRVVL